MRLAQTTRNGQRYTLEATRLGLTTRTWRPRLGGGWYPKNVLTFPWPWRGAA